MMQLNCTEEGYSVTKRKLGDAVGLVPMSRRSPEERKTDVDDIMKWFRSQKDNSLDPSGMFKKLDELLPLDCMRNKGVKPNVRSS